MIWLITGIVFLFPLFFFPWLIDSLLVAKGFFLSLGILLIFLVAGIRLYQKKKLSYSFSSLDALIFFFWLVNLASWFFLPRGAKVRSLIQPLGLGTISLLTFFYLALVQLRKERKKNLIFQALVVAAVFASLVAVTLFILPDSFFPWKFLTNSSWTFLGSIFSLFQFLILVALFLLKLIIEEVNQKGKLKNWSQIVWTIIILVGLGVSLYQIIESKPKILDWFSSWAIAVESFKRNPLLGLGPSNFNIAFNRYRPIEFNNTSNWNFRFNASHNWPLQVWSEAGLAGLFFLILIFLKTLPLIRKSKFGLISFLAWVLVFIFPPNLINLFLLYLGLALIRDEGKEKRFSLIFGDSGVDGAPYLFGGGLVILFLVGTFFLYKICLSEIFFYQGLRALAENRGGDSYNHQATAIRNNPFLFRNRISFAQTNLALADNLANKQTELTDEEKQQITQLINQAINESKAAVALEPRNAVVWENLAQVYRRLINTAQGAEQWALTAFQQTIALDSLNPILRINFGGLFYSLGNFEEAGRQFEIAVTLKPDHANSWYNWAWALKQKGDLEEAVVKLQQSVNLVERETVDFEKASQELKEWKEELGKELILEEPEEPEELIQPQPLPSPSLEEPIELSEEAAPPLKEELEQETN